MKTYTGWKSEVIFFSLAIPFFVGVFTIIGLIVQLIKRLIQ